MKLFTKLTGKLKRGDGFFLSTGIRMYQISEGTVSQARDSKIEENKTTFTLKYMSESTT